MQDDPPLEATEDGGRMVESYGGLQGIVKLFILVNVLTSRCSGVKIITAERCGYLPTHPKFPLYIIHTAFLKGVKGAVGTCLLPIVNVFLSVDGNHGYLKEACGDSQEMPEDFLFKAHNTS